MPHKMKLLVDFDNIQSCPSPIRAQIKLFEDLNQELLL